MSELCLSARRAALILASLTALADLPAQAMTRQAAVADVNDAAATPGARLERIQRLSARVDSIGLVLRAALSRRNDVRLTDTVHAGAFAVATTSDLRVEVQQAAQRAWLAIAPRIDAETRDSLAGTVIRVRQPQDGETRFIRTKQLHIERPAPRTQRRGIYGGTRVARRRLGDALLQIASTVAASSMDGQLRDWAVITELPLVPVAKAVEDDARIAVATAPSRAARECWRGTVVACERLLMLAGRPDSALGAWYAPEDYRGAVHRLRLDPNDPPGAPALQRRCLDRRDGSACERLLRSLSPARIPSPVFTEPHIVLIDEALAAGGAGALDRLRHSRGTLAERLSAASGLPIAMLLTRWRARLVEKRRRDVPPALAITFAALGWTTLFGSLSLRGTRRCS